MQGNTYNQFDLNIKLLTIVISSGLIDLVVSHKSMIPMARKTTN